MLRIVVLDVFHRSFTDRLDTVDEGLADHVDLVVVVGEAQVGGPAVRVLDDGLEHEIETGVLDVQRVRVEGNARFEATGQGRGRDVAGPVNSAVNLDLVHVDRQRGRVADVAGEPEAVVQGFFFRQRLAPEFRGIVQAMMSDQTHPTASWYRDHLDS